MTALRFSLIAPVRLVLTLCLWLFLGANLVSEELLYEGAGAPLFGATPDSEVIYDKQQKPWAWVANPDIAAQATVVFFHGANGRAEQRWHFYRDYFVRRGIRIVFAEYPSYGERTGQPLTQAHVKEDATALMAKIKAAYSDAPLWVAGESTGAALAAQLGQAASVEKILLMTPWHRLDTLVEQRYPWLPARWLVEQPLDSCKALYKQSAKVRLVYAENDRDVPVQHAKSLAGCLNLPAASLLQLPQASHHDWAVRMNADQWDWLLNTTK